MYKILLLIVIFFCSLSPAQANDDKALHIAVASNFISTLEKIAQLFTEETGYKVIISSGSTGVIYTQIVNNAPFDVFLSADMERPEKLEISGRAVADSRITYAIGRLAFWHPDRKSHIDRVILKAEEIEYMAIANPKLSPYGLAAKEVLIYQNLWQDKPLLRANNIAQSFHFIENNQKVAGFVSLSQLLKLNIIRSSYWIIPDNYYSPIKQQAILLKDCVAGWEFIKFLTSDAISKIIQQDGYKI